MQRILAVLTVAGQFAAIIAAFGSAVAAYFVYAQTSILERSQRTYVDQIKLEVEYSGCKTLVSNLYDMLESDNIQVKIEQKRHEMNIRRSSIVMQNDQKKTKYNSGNSFGAPVVGFGESDIDDGFAVSNIIGSGGVKDYRKQLEIVTFSLDKDTKEMVLGIIDTLDKRPDIYSESGNENMQKYVEWRNDLEKATDAAKGSCLALMTQSYK